MRVGRTIAEERERIESESDRLAARELSRRREAMQTAILVVAVVAIVILGVISVKNLLNKGTGGGSSEKLGSEVTYVPTVQVIDESGASAKMSRRMSEFIGMVEADFKEIGFKVTRVAIPTGLAREVDVYISGGGSSGAEGSGSEESDSEGSSGELPYYFKMNIDRGSGVSVEDAERMVRYLSERGLTPSYVDVRVEGKAFYR